MMLLSANSESCILDAYANEDVTRFLEMNFSPVLRRPLTFHLAQAGLSIQSFREIARLLRARAGQ